MLSLNLVSLWSRVNTKKATVEPKICSTRMDFTIERLSFNPDAGRRFLSLENTNRMESAAEGYAEAMNALGSLFYNELKDYKQAVEWFKKAAERGFTRALSNLGLCYEYGHGVDKDRDTAF